MANDVKIYETSFLVDDPLVCEEINALLQKFNGEVVFNKEPDKIGLAYPIKKKTQAFFGYIYFKMLSKDLNSFEKTLRQNQKILRFMVVKDPFIPKIANIENVSSVDHSVKPIPRLTELTNEEIKKKIEEILEEK